jgi:hypothetical protein
LAGNQRDEGEIAQIDEQLIKLMGSEPRSS